MLRALLPTLLVVAAFSGCFGDDAPALDQSPEPGDQQSVDDNETAPSQDPSPTHLPANETTPAAPPVAIVEIVNHTPEFGARGPIEVTWNVTLDPAAAAVANSTAIYWADRSVPNASKPADYGNMTNLTRDAQIPGNFSAQFAPGAMTVYFRAFVSLNGTWFLSEETVSNLTAGGAAGGPQTHTVSIGGTTDGPVADYAPLRLSIAAGDSVVFENEDSVAHTATDRDGSFDTGAIAGGQASEPVLFDAAGTFLYHCTVHATMVGAVIEVTPPR